MMSSAHLAAIAHHCRSRLATVIPELEQAGLEALGGILRAVADDINAIQLLAQIDDDQPLVKLQDVDLQSFFDDVQRAARQRIPEHLRLISNADFSQCLFPCWSFDAPLVRMILLDAVSNAFRYAHRDIQFSACIENGMLVWSITDDGPGFPLLVLEGEAVAPHEAGSGQGLYLARQLCEAHCLNGRRGSLVLQNTPGACLSFRFP